jgi:hypothetical protein
MSLNNLDTLPDILGNGLFTSPQLNGYRSRPPRGGRCENQSGWIEEFLSKMALN